MKATRSKAFETTPRIQTTILGTEKKYDNSSPTLAVLFSTICN